MPTYTYRPLAHVTRTPNPPGPLRSPSTPQAPPTRGRTLVCLFRPGGHTEAPTHSKRGADLSALTGSVLPAGSPTSWPVSSVYFGGREAFLRLRASVLFAADTLAPQLLNNLGTDAPAVPLTVLRRERCGHPVVRMNQLNSDQPASLPGGIGGRGRRGGCFPTPSCPAGGDGHPEFLLGRLGPTPGVLPLVCSLHLRAGSGGLLLWWLSLTAKITEMLATLGPLP